MSQWWEVRLKASWGSWAQWAGPFDDEELAHDFVDNVNVPGREVAICKVTVYASVTL